MPYSSVAQIQGEFRSLSIGSSTAITTAETEEFIAEADALIDSKVGLRYLVPISSVNSPKSFLIMRMISRKLVSYRIKDILEVKGSAEPQTNQVVRGDLSRKDLLQMLEDIAKGKMILEDATVASTSQGLSSFAVENCEEQFFKKNTDQW